MGGFLSFHNKVTKVLDPIGITEKVTGSNDPLDLYGGATKANNERMAKESAKALAEGTAKSEADAASEYEKIYGRKIIRSGGQWL